MVRIPEKENHIIPPFFPDAEISRLFSWFRVDFFSVTGLLKVYMVLLSTRNKLLRVFCCLAGLGWLCCLCYAEDLPSTLPDGVSTNRDASVRLYVPVIQGEMSLAERKQLTQRTLETLGRFSDVRSFTEEDFSRQKQWLRAQGSLSCTFYEECRDRLMENLGITHTLRLALEPGPKEDSLVIVLDLQHGIRHRTIREALPDQDTAKVAIPRFLPDLLGLSDSLDENRGMIRLTSRPLGAKVSIHGQELGETPLVVHLPPSPTLALSFHGPNRNAVTKTLSVQAGQWQTLDADLVRENGKLLVDTTPAGATVFIDGERQGESPYLKPIPEGRHHIRLELPPYPAFEKEMEIRPHEVTRIVHAFMSASVPLRVEAPRGDTWDKETEIWLDGNLVAYERYTGNLASGTHQLAVVREGYETYYEEVSLQPGIEERIIAPHLDHGLTVRPGQKTVMKNDYRPATFTTIAGVLALGFGIYLELEAQKHLKTSRDKTLTSSQRSSARQDAYLSRGFGATLMSLGTLATATGATFFFLPFQRTEAVWPQQSHPDEDKPAKQEPNEPFVVGAMMRGTF